jgi:hypothetical protein
MAAAAGLVLVVRPGGSPPQDAAAPAAQIALLPELESLDATDLETVLQLLPDPDGSAEIRILDELTDDEMTRLLNGLEG